MFKNRYLFATSLVILVFRALFCKQEMLTSWELGWPLWWQMESDIKNHVQAMELSVLVDLGVFSPLGRKLPWLELRGTFRIQYGFQRHRFDEAYYMRPHAQMCGFFNRTQGNLYRVGENLLTTLLWELCVCFLWRREGSFGSRLHPWGSWLHPWVGGCWELL